MVITTDASSADEPVTQRVLSLLIGSAQNATNPTRVSKHFDFGGVGAALLTVDGTVYTGVCIDTSSSMGMCSEVAAAAAMLTAGETQVVAMVAVDWEGRVLAPCGKCREFFSQLEGNPHVAVDSQTTVKLSDLLPFDWKKT